MARSTAVQRYYASTISRFLTADPYVANDARREPQSWNRYPYVMNDPANLVDPEGLRHKACLDCELIGIGGIFMGGFTSPPDPEGGLGSGPPTGGAVIGGGSSGGGSAGKGSGSREPTPREVMLNRRAQVHDVIYGTGDTVFGPEILDCMAGRESDWDPNADNGKFRGMFQMGEAAWTEVYKGVPDAPAYFPNVFDPRISAAAAATYLNIRLTWSIGTPRYASGDYAEEDLKAAIRDYNGSSIAESYANQIWDCAQQLKAGDLEGALRAINKP